MFSAENFQFLKLKKSLIIAWASFRYEKQLSLCIKKQHGVPTSSDTNRPVQVTRSLKYRIKEKEGLHYLSGE